MQPILRQQLRSPPDIREKRNLFLGKLLDKDQSTTNATHTNLTTTPIPTVSDIRKRRSLFLDKLLGDTHMDDIPSGDNSDWDNQDMEILRREKRRGRGGVVGEEEGVVGEEEG